VIGHLSQLRLRCDVPFIFCTQFFLYSQVCMLANYIFNCASFSSVVRRLIRLFVPVADP